jgi:preprotein translocase subunit SecB
MKTENNNLKFSFQAIRFTEFNFVVNKEYDAKMEKDAPIEMAPEILIGYSVTDFKNCTILVEIRLLDSKAPFSFSVKSEAQFLFENELRDESELKKIVHINLAAIVYPFVREPVADLTRKMGFSPLLLPPVNFVEFYQNNVLGEVKKSAV